MSGNGDLKTHMEKSSIKELIKYINDGDTPPSCNDIYTIAQAIQYMDDTYLREFTDDKLRSMKADKPKTPVPYNEWIRCMFKPIEETWHEPTHIEKENWSHDHIMHNSNNDGVSCASNECRESKGLGSCLPKKRMLKDNLSPDNFAELRSLYDEIMKNKIGELKKIIDDAYSVKGAYKNLKKYVLDDANLNDWKTCIDNYKKKKSCDNACAIGKTPKICRPKSAKRISSKPVASYIQAYDQLANAIEETDRKEKEQKEKEQKEKEQNEKEQKEKEQKEKEQNELNRKEMKQNRTEMERFTAQGLDPLSGSIALTPDQLEAIQKEKDRKPIGPRGRAAAKNAAAKKGAATKKAAAAAEKAAAAAEKAAAAAEKALLPSKIEGGGKTRKRKTRSSTKKHKKRTKYKKRASTKKHKKYKKKRRSTRKR
jgi:hypothetical protein